MGHKQAELVQGFKVFIGLGILTAIEYGIAVASGSVLLLAAIALAKVAIIATYFMHAGKLIQTDEGEHE